MSSLHDDKSQNGLYMLLGVFFTGVALVSLVSLVVIRSKAASMNTNADQTITTNNTAPTASTPEITRLNGQSYVSLESNVLPLTVNSFQPIRITTQVEDANNLASPDNDIMTVTTIFYDADAVTAPTDCSKGNETNCYTSEHTIGDTDLHCGPQNGYDQTPQQCTDVTSFSIPFFANDSGNWKAKVIVADRNQAKDTAYSANTTLLGYLSINTASAISYGTVVVGATGTSKDYTVTNTGNRRAGVAIASEDFLCASPGVATTTIPFNLIAFNGNTLTLSQGAGGNVIAAIDLRVNEHKDATDALSTTTTFSKVGAIPAGIKGSCEAMAYSTAIDIE